MSTTNTSGTGSSQSSHSHSEVGHIKNVANFNVLISTCQGFGTSYNPTHSAITVTALQALYNTADTAVTNSTNVGNTMQQAINARINAFVNVKPTATRIMAALIACGADAETIKNAQTINRKIQGGRAKAVSGSSTNSGTGTGTATGGSTTGGTNGGASATGTTPAASGKQVVSTLPGVAPVVISVSQQSFDRFVSNFRALVNYASQIPAYHPNETDLQVTALNTYLTTLQNANNAVITAHVNYNSAVVTRTKVLYDAVNGLVHIALEIKQYVASVYGANSLQAKQVKHIKFRTLK